MIARHRGDIRGHFGWRPLKPPAGPSGEPSVAEPKPIAVEGTAPSEQRSARRTWRQRAARRLSYAIVAVATLAAIGVVIRTYHAVPASTGKLLPGTARQWVDEWTAASVESPARVCSQLFAPALARAFKTDTGHSCIAYYGRVTSVSFPVRRVLQAGPAAAVEAREVGAKPNWGYFTVLISHLRGGWQAVDIVPGGPIHPR